MVLCWELFNREWTRKTSFFYCSELTSAAVLKHLYALQSTTHSHVCNTMSFSLHLYGLNRAAVRSPPFNRWGNRGRKDNSHTLSPSPGDLPNPGIKPKSPALQVDSLLSEPPWKPKLFLYFWYKNNKKLLPWIQVGSSRNHWCFVSREMSALQFRLEDVGIWSPSGSSLSKVKGQELTATHHLLNYWYC